MVFIQSCFIRKNTPELRKKLEKLGYKPCYQMTIHPDLYKNIYVCRFFGDMYYGVTDIDCSITNDFKNRGMIDCKTNEEMFIAIAALRDDTNEHQWFIATDTLCDENYDGEITTYFEKRQWMEYDEWSYIEELPSYFRKATVEEIIEHFKIQN